MRDLPKSRYDENGRPIKGRKPNNSSYKRPNENTFFGEQSKIHTIESPMSIYSKKPAKKQQLIGIGVFYGFILLVVVATSFNGGFDMDAFSDAALFLILIPLVIFINYQKYKTQLSNPDKDEISLFSSKDDKDLVDKVDADLLEEGDFDADKADKIIEEFNK